MPLVSPALLAAMLMVFAIASRELVTSLLLAPAGTQTVSVFIWRQFEQGSVGQGMAMATLTLVTGLLLMLSALSSAKKHICAYGAGKIVYKQGISHQGSQPCPHF